MVTCPRCGRQNPEENEFCGRCGTELRSAAPPPPDSGEPMFCYRHKKEPTNLRCGRCERPICHRCVVIGPAGPRCHECARQNVSVRPGAIAHEAKVGLRKVMGMGPWAIYLWIVLLGMVFGFARGCFRQAPEPPPDASSSQEVQAPE